MPVLHLKSRKGQTLVETALILPIIVLILTGIIDFGLAFGNLLLINSISREAARSAAVGNTYLSIFSQASSMAQTLDQAKLQISITPSESYRRRGEYVTVTVRYDNTLFTPVISSVIPNPLGLTAKTTMRVE